MDYEAYVKYFINLDEILLDGTTSYALGTVLLALYFNKKIYLNDSGVLAKSFKMKNIKYYDIQSLNYIDYDELINMQEISQNLIPLCDPITVWLDSLYQVE